MKVAVIDQNKQPLMPCCQRRAKELIKTKQAKPYFQGGLFCIMLLREPSARNLQPIMIGIDTGSQREGYTIATEKEVIFNITTNTPYWVKGNVKKRRSLRRNRRYRKTPYRECRKNRSVLRSRGLAPSTLACWDAKLRIISKLSKIIPITHINVEDIKAKTEPGNDKKNLSFSPLEIGKNWFYECIRNLGYKLTLTEGFDTMNHRKSRGFKKLPKGKKMLYVWESHNVDSHSLVEIAFGVKIRPEYGLYKLEFLQYARRALHVQNPINGGFRRADGSTVSMGISRGSIARWKTEDNGEKRNVVGYIGGSSKGKVTMHNKKTKVRISQGCKVEEILVYYHNRIIVNYINDRRRGAIPPTTEVVGFLCA